MVVRKFGISGETYDAWLKEWKVTGLVDLRGVGSKGSARKTEDLNDDEITRDRRRSGNRDLPIEVPVVEEVIARRQYPKTKTSSTADIMLSSTSKHSPLPPSDIEDAPNGPPAGLATIADTGSQVDADPHPSVSSSKPAAITTTAHGKEDGESQHSVLLERASGTRVATPMNRTRKHQKADSSGITGRSPTSMNFLCSLTASTVPSLSHSSQSTTSPQTAPVILWKSRPTAISFPRKPTAKIVVPPSRTMGDVRLMPGSYLASGNGGFTPSAGPGSVTLSTSWLTPATTPKTYLGQRSNAPWHTGRRKLLPGQACRAYYGGRRASSNTVAKDKEELGQTIATLTEAESPLVSERVVISREKEDVKAREEMRHTLSDDKRCMTAKVGETVLEDRKRQEEKARLKEKIEGLEERVKELEVEKTALTAEHDTFAKETEAIRVDLTKKAKDAEDISRALEEANRSLISANQSLEMEQKEIKSRSKLLNAELTKVAGQLDEMKSVVAGWDSRKTKDGYCGDACNKNIGFVEKLRRENLDLLKRNIDLVKGGEEAKMRVGEIEGMLDKLRSQSEGLNAVIVKLLGSGADGSSETVADIPRIHQREDRGDDNPVRPFQVEDPSGVTDTTPSSLAPIVSAQLAPTQPVVLVPTPALREKQDPMTEKEVLRKDKEVLRRRCMDFNRMNEDFSKRFAAHRASAESASGTEDSSSSRTRAEREAALNKERAALELEREALEKEGAALKRRGADFNRRQQERKMRIEAIPGDDQRARGAEVGKQTERGKMWQREKQLLLMELEDEVECRKAELRLSRLKRQLLRSEDGAGVGEESDLERLGEDQGAEGLQSRRMDGDQLRSKGKSKGAEDISLPSARQQRDFGVVGFDETFLDPRISSSRRKRPRTCDLQDAELPSDEDTSYASDLALPARKRNSSTLRRAIR
ncbi:hypothetical protein ONZ45_g9815 [Pleurotus djamor]|nr:hypothetical protein ONZ45_g9815 [Pleurotus djamor]